jgi:hypothetical protein
VEPEHTHARPLAMAQRRGGRRSTSGVVRRGGVAAGREGADGRRPGSCAGDVAASDARLQVSLRPLPKGRVSVFQERVPVEGSRVSPPHRPRGDELVVGYRAHLGHACTRAPLAPDVCSQRALAPPAIGQLPAAPGATQPCGLQDGRALGADGGGPGGTPRTPHPDRCLRAPILAVVLAPAASLGCVRLPTPASQALVRRTCGSAASPEGSHMRATRVAEAKTQATHQLNLCSRTNSGTRTSSHSSPRSQLQLRLRAASSTGTPHRAGGWRGTHTGRLQMHELQQLASERMLTPGSCHVPPTKVVTTNLVTIQLIVRVNSRTHVPIKSIRGFRDAMYH